MKPTSRLEVGLIVLAVLDAIVAVHAPSVGPGPAQPQVQKSPTQQPRAPEKVTPQLKEVDPDMAIIGYNTAGSGWTGGGIPWFHGSWFTCPETGTVTQLHANFRDVEPGIQAKAAIYEYDGGAQVVVSAAQVIAEGWNTFQIDVVLLEEAEIYVLGVILEGPSAAKLTWDAGEADQFLRNADDETWLDPLDDPMSFSPIDNSKASIYAEIEERQAAQGINPTLGYMNARTASTHEITVTDSLKLTEPALGLVQTHSITVTDSVICDDPNSAGGDRPTLVSPCLGRYIDLETMLGLPKTR